MSWSLATASARRYLVARNFGVVASAPQVAQQRLVVHPAQNRVGTEHRAAGRGQGQEVALLPRHHCAMKTAILCEAGNVIYLTLQDDHKMATVR